MQACSTAIDQRNHHPEWSNVYNRVEVLFRTHDANNRVTSTDIVSAMEMETTFQRDYAQSQAR